LNGPSVSVTTRSFGSVSTSARPVAVATIGWFLHLPLSLAARRTGVAAARSADLVKRDFTATRPNELWVVDFTYVATLAGFVYAAFAIDVFSQMIVGWRAARSMKTDLPLHALDMALWHRGRAGHDVTGLVHHSDAGSQGGFNRSTQHLNRMRCSDGSTSGVDDDGDGQVGDAFAWTSSAAA